MKEPFVEWKEDFSIGVETVDEQHKGLFNLANELYDVCEKEGVTTEYFKEVLQKTVNYVILHFSTEERIMKQYNDPCYEEHQNEHGIFVRKVMQEAANLENGEADAPKVFMDFLRDWIGKHVTGTDIKIGQHIESLREQGQISRDAAV